jgi:hypothetical protein
MEIKFNAELKGEEIRVNAQFSREQEETEENPAGMVVVHEVNTAFPLGTSENKIRREIQKAGDLFELEEKQRAGQQEVDEKFEKANKIINNLNQ